MNPIVNINGTSRKELVELQRELANKLDGAITALIGTKPHQRDYLGDNARYSTDRCQYDMRYALLDNMRKAVLDDALRIHNGGDSL